MRPGTLYLSLVTLTFAFTLLGVGTVVALIAFVPSLQEQLLSWLTNPQPWLTVAGAGIVLSGILVLFGATVFPRKGCMQLRMGDLSVDIEPALLNRYLEQYWRQVFPQGKVFSGVSIHRGRIAIEADLPPIPLEEQRRVLQRAELDLVELFDKVLAYHRDFTLSVSFS